MSCNHTAATMACNNLNWSEMCVVGHSVLAMHDPTHLVPRDRVCSASRDLRPTGVVGKEPQLFRTCTPRQQMSAGNGPRRAYQTVG